MTSASVTPRASQTDRDTSLSQACGQTAKISTSFAVLLLCLLLVGCGGSVAAKDVPPSGQMWFGQSFDPKTFVMTGQRTTVGTQEPVALVAHLTKPLEAGMTLRASLDGTLIGSAPITYTGSGELFGYVLNALGAPGEYRYDIVDVGGNVLASGSVTAQ